MLETTMLKSLHLKDFTVFPESELKFGVHLNVIVQQRLKQILKPIDAHPRVVELDDMTGVPWTARSVASPA